MPSKLKGDKISPKKKTSKKSPTLKLKDQIKSLNGNLIEQKDKHLRLKAEFDNYRRRKEKDTINLLKYDGENIIKSFLSVLDNLDRLEKALADNKKLNKEKIHEGIELILNNINKRFTELEVQPFGKSGDLVDHELHDALMMRSEKGKTENEILEVFEKGYRYKDRVIRHAKVVVNQTPS
ncbi:nucleotide exchange factor GrpE [Candidatus Marinimicrobia bacterium]|nr:nucleotide exchange factor GrpE [Candidatus Neomarinimicrobiota bacterium]